MDARIPTRLTAAEGRKFGLTVGLAFVAIGLVLLWRAHTTPAVITLGIGGMLVVAGLVFPTTLGPVEHMWMGIALLISRVTTPIVMGIVYFAVITPIGYLRNLGKGSPMHRRGRGVSSWISRTANETDPQRMERQF